MTGFGNAKIEIKNKIFNIQIKSLNSKQLDISLKIPQDYFDKENYIRNIIAKKLTRGKIILNLQVENNSALNNTSINKEIIYNYIEQIKEIEKETGIKEQNILQTVFKLPNVFYTEESETIEKEWLQIEKLINKAINELQNFRTQEGKAMQNDITKHIKSIEQLLNKISDFEQNRIKNIKHRIQNSLKEYLSNENIDKERFEQEIIYFLEKLDITEEKIRLKNHCNFFIQTTKNKTPVGKKLNFIAQEIGREINTIGSKANDMNIQKIVVEMKDELEKVKEQLLNIL